tara:strand:+ start:2899 stop:3894 length:996 start_codon:yes stop_codon:yes gene_type:complete
VHIHSSAPTRIDLAGGTLDIWPLYLYHSNAQTLNAAITIRAVCEITDFDGEGIKVISEDTQFEREYSHWSDLNKFKTPELLREALCHFEPKHLKITTRSQSPVGAGLAGSSAMCIAICGALARWSKQEVPTDKLMTLAMNLEAKVLGVPSGVQDYRPAVYGGIASIELTASGVNRVKLSVDPMELSKRIVLVYTGQSRNSGINNWEVTKKRIDGDLHITNCFNLIRDTTLNLRSALDSQDWNKVGQLINREWELRKQLAPSVTTHRIDELIKCGRDGGALAAKVCGAGGGGCILFLTEPTNVSHLKHVLRSQDVRVLEAKVDSEGLKIKSD